VIELLAPEQACEALTLDTTRVLGHAGCQCCIERIRFLNARRKHVVEGRTKRIAGDRIVGEPEFDRRGLAAGHVEPVPSRRLRSALVGIDGMLGPGDDVVVDAVLDPLRPILATEQPSAVRLVLREQQVGRALAQQHAIGRAVIPRTS
jgi:hypothetical protein